MAGESGHTDYCSGISAIASAFLWLAAVVLGILVDANGVCFNNLRFAIFQNKSYTVYSSWMTEITPAKWTFSMSAFTYTWNMLWVVYCVANMCPPAKHNARENVSQCVNIFPTSFHILWSLCSITHAGWLLLWDREAFVASLFMQVFMIAGCITCLVISHKKISCCGALLQYRRPWDLWVARTLVQNGITIIVVWNTFLLSINLIILLVFKAKVEMQVASTVVWSVFVLLVALWIFIDIAVMDAWLRYTFTFYPTVVWIACGVMSNNFVMWSPVTIASIALVGLSILGITIRVPLVVFRSFTNPLYIEQTIPHKVDITRRKNGLVTTVL
ncbi:uncharacterized protein LOC143444131 [Clavelina lepadiformis]|uniref:uncharacterized protein LOC143444131 n=1 Tax=Clavelina lepadiformis TaxID=159417 RepID=UPI004042A440